MTTAPVRRFVAVGDSFTEGLYDFARPDGTFVGWADRLAALLAGRQDEPVAYANLAVRGKLLDQVIADQVPLALGYAPDVLSFHAGGNDALRSSISVDDVVARWGSAVAAITAPGRRVLGFTVLERSGSGSGPSNAFTDKLAARIARFNDGVRAAAAEIDGVDLVDLAAARVLEDRRLWNGDRLHLNPSGHARVARAALQVLDGVGDGGWSTPLPTVRAPSPSRAVAQDLGWAALHLAPWMSRRLRGISSGDGRVGKRLTLADVEPDLVEDQVS